jgi:hypothetical protein
MEVNRVISGSEKLKSGRWLAAAIQNPVQGGGIVVGYERFGYGYTKQEAERNALAAWDLSKEEYQKMLDAEK